MKNNKNRFDEDALRNPPTPELYVTRREDQIEYLSRIGELRFADNVNWIWVRLMPEGERVSFSLYGWQNMFDALAALREDGHIGRREFYRFFDWPHASAASGPGFRERPACVCELLGVMDFRGPRIQVDLWPDEPGPNETPDAPLPSPEDWNERITEYLMKLGKRKDANQLFPVRFLHPTTSQPMTVQLRGRDITDEALSGLKARGYLSEFPYGEEYTFPNWPAADPRFGPWYRDFPACVCELGSEPLRMEAHEPKPVRVMYGCPVPSELERVKPKKTVEVVAYEQDTEEAI